MSKDKFSIELFDSICDEISISNAGLVPLCKKNNINPTSFYRWIEKDEDLRNKYARARQLQAEVLADEIIELASKERATVETMVGETDKGSISSEIRKDNYNRTRLEIDARKWLASKLAPKKYGNTLDLTTLGEKIENVLPPFMIASNNESKS